MSEMWTHFEVEWKFITSLCGSIPADPDIQRKWLEARRPKHMPAGARPLEELQAEVASTMPTVEEEEEQRLSVFQRVEGGLVMRSSTIRAHFKDCGRVISGLYYGKTEGEKSFAVRVLNGVYYPPDQYWVPIVNQADGKQFSAPSGTDDKTIHVTTRQGQRNAFKSFEYVENAQMTFQIKILTTPARDNKPGRLVVTEKELAELFEYGGTHGYGGERGDGEGRYEATFHRIENFTKKPRKEF